MKSPLKKWIGRIDPDGRYALYREKLVSVAPARKTPRHQKDVWAILVSVPDMLEPEPGRKSRVLRYGCTLPLLPLLVAVYNAMSGNRALASQEGVEPLGLSTSLSPRKRARRGSRGLTSHGKRIVRNGAHLLEQKVGKDQLAFATFTFPALHPDDWEAVLENWSKCLDNFKHRLSEALQRGGLPGLLVGCIEVQEKRRTRDGSPALHVHLVFQGRKRRKSWLLTPKRLRKLWKNQWEKVLKFGYDWSATENVQRVVKSAGRYLAKYLSKGFKSVNPQGSEAEMPHIPAWYVCSKALKLAIKMNTHKSYAIGEWLSESVRDDKDMFRWMDLITIQGQDGGCYAVCYFGQFREWKPKLVYPPGM